MAWGVAGSGVPVEDMVRVRNVDDMARQAQCGGSTQKVVAGMVSTCRVLVLSRRATCTRVGVQA